MIWLQKEGWALPESYARVWFVFIGLQIKKANRRVGGSLVSFACLLNFPIFSPNNLVSWPDSKIKKKVTTTYNILIHSKVTQKSSPFNPVSFSVLARSLTFLWLTKAQIDF